MGQVTKWKNINNYDGRIVEEVRVYTIKIDDKAHKVSIEVAMLLKAVSEERDELKDLAIWMTRCGYDFCQHLAPR